MRGFDAMIVATGLLGVLPWVLGRLIFETGVAADSPVRRWSLAERVFAELVVAWVCLGWIGVGLAQVGAFTPRNLVAIAAVLAAVLAARVMRRGWRPFADPAWRVDVSALMVATLVVAGSLWYTPSFEQVVGGRDATTYVLAGVSMGRDGSLVHVSDNVREIPESGRRDLLGFDQRDVHTYYSRLFFGWYLVDPDIGKAVPQGLPFYPTAIAVGYWVGGVEGALRTTTVLTIAALVALFFLGRRLAGVAVGTTAATLMLVSPAQVWFSRYATAEAMAQLLVIVGLYGLLAYRRHRDAAYGLMSSVAFGLCWQTHIWLTWLVFPLGGLLVVDLLGNRVERRDVVVFWGPLTILGLHALLFYATLGRHYVYDTLMVVRDSPWALLPAVLMLLLLVAVLWMARRRGVARHVAPAAGNEGDGLSAPEAAGLWTPSKVRWSFAALFAGLAVYGAWIRPLVASGWRADSVTRLLLATTSAAYVLAIVGGVLLIVDRRRRTPTLSILAIAVGASVPVLAEPNIIPGMMWSLRRYQPTIFPAVFLLAAVGIWWVTERLSARSAATSTPVWYGRLALAGSMTVTTTLVSVLAINGVAYRGFKEPGAAVDMIEAIHGSVEEDAVLIFEARSGWPLLSFAASLELWKGHDVLWLRNKVANPEVLRDYVRRQARQGRPVYFFTQGFQHFFAEPHMVFHRWWWFTNYDLGPDRTKLPETVHLGRVVFSSYLVEPGGVAEPLKGILDVGSRDELYIAEMTQPEYGSHGSSRWTKGTAFAWLPGLDATVSQISIDMSTFLDAEGSARRLRVSLDGVELGQVEVRRGWRTYEFDIPSEWQPSRRAPRLQLSTEPLRPIDVLGTNDRRYLGVNVKTISWR